MSSDASEKRKAAIRLNGSQGGVKTPRGKSVVRWNAKKHGILGMLRTDYEGNVYNSYLRQLYDEHQPVGFTESMLVKRIALCCLMLHRAAKVEREFMLSRLKPPVFSKLSFIDYDEQIKPLEAALAFSHVDVERFLNTLKTTSEDCELVPHTVKNDIANMLVLNIYVAEQKVASVKLNSLFENFIKHPTVRNGGRGGI